MLPSNLKTPTSRNIFYALIRSKLRAENNFKVIKCERNYCQLFREYYQATIEVGSNHSSEIATVHFLKSDETIKIYI